MNAKSVATKAPAPKRPVHVAVVVALAPTAVVGTPTAAVGDPIDPANQAGVDGTSAYVRNMCLGLYGP